ncbi:MAG: hypothetical protein P8076_15020 [Gammaproteobacteria bacterium]
MTEVCIATPLDDYELLDFGGGRKLERLGPYRVERPEPRARGPRSLPTWDPDWSYSAVAAASRWSPTRAGLPRAWQIRVDGLRLHIRLGDDGGVGFDPAQVACWRWIRRRLEGCYHLDTIHVANLFAGSGGASAAARASGALVDHVEADEAVLARARGNADEGQVAWVHEDVHAFVDQALRGARAYDLVLVRPPDRVRGPHGRAWDISCDLNALLFKLPRLAGSACRGLWLAPRETERGKEWTGETLRRLLRDSFPGQTVDGIEIGIATADGRVLPAGAAACWADDEAGLVETSAQAPLNAEAMEERLDVYLDPVLSSRRTAAAPARALAGFGREQQEFVLRWVEAASRSNAEMAYQFAAHAPRALEQMDPAQVEQWLLEAMDVFDTAGLHPAVAALQDVDGFAEALRARHTSVLLDEVAATLEVFVHGLAGRKLKLERGAAAVTDTETLFLPEALGRFPERRDNFELYKAMTAQLWAQAWFGTYRVDLERRLDAFPDPAHAGRQFQVLERVRLDACIERELPGLWRQMTRLCEALGEACIPPGWEAAAEALHAPAATVETTLEQLPRVYGRPPADAVCYQWQLDLARVRQVRAARAEREKRQFQVMLVRMAEEARARADAPPPAPPDVGLLREPDETQPDPAALQFTVDGRPTPPPVEARGLISSIIQDFGDIPPEYLVAAGDGGYKPDPREPRDPSQDVWKGTYHEEGAFLYNEWDYRRQHYRKNWCVLRESDVPARDPEFVQRALRRYSGLVKNVRRTFEVLRGEEKLLKRQTYGDDVDIDAIVEAYGDVRSGMEMTDRLLTRKQKLERNIAVMFMVDMSGSTKGWINDAEREALVLLCEALESLGDRYAIYGFSGMTRKRCELYRVKRFDEPYGDEVMRRISGIGPQDYTRMGVTIRHLSRLLNQVEARTRLLITLSDGKPDDFDGYRGEYGIEDTRMALIEAKRDGIHPFCITIDTEARDYLPHMYGAVNYTVIDEVRKLPLRVSDIYRKLTT